MFNLVVLARRMPEQDLLSENAQTSTARTISTIKLELKNRGRTQLRADNTAASPLCVLMFCLVISSIPTVAVAQLITPTLECPGDDIQDSDYQQLLQNSITGYLRKNPDDTHFQNHLMRATGKFSKIHVAIWTGCMGYAQRLVAARLREDRDLAPVLDRPWHAFDIMLNPPTPLTYAIYRRRPEFVRFLIEAGADMTVTEPWLRKFYGQNSQWPRDMTYFHQAALSQDAQIIAAFMGSFAVGGEILR